ncbi:TetR/AcrR family transcriptional regulator [Nocardia sp. NPDC050378]|uniref:TetR/AcrR family transcriptional regulator n=1 Tax=Nocardia sp. NPDC050378 TaxID=3155400 RepID=UPI0033F7B53E
MSKAQGEKSEARTRLGRPRDGSIRRKVVEAAIECYAERGWSGFSFESVSIAAGVGRPALYRRWSGREELLIDAFRESTQTLQLPDHGNVAEDLTDLALAHRRLLVGARGRAGMRLFIEREAVAEVFRTIATEITAQRDRIILEVLERGRSRGELDSGVDLNIASQLLVGALMLDALVHERTTPQIRVTVTKTVETLMRGLNARPADAVSSERGSSPSARKR